METFGRLFYQRWTFFTPPPKMNERVFFHYLNTQDTTDLFTVEVLSEINEKRKLNPLINVSQEILEDILLNNTYGLNNSLSSYYTLLKKSFPDSTDQYLAKQMENYLTDPEKQPIFFKTLHNYAKIVLSKHEKDPKKYKFKIVMTSIPIIPFKDRYNIKYKAEETILFETPIIKL